MIFCQEPVLPVIVLFYIVCNFDWEFAVLVFGILLAVVEPVVNFVAVYPPPRLVVLLPRIRLFLV